jgi:hypothetical protein
MYRMEGTVVAKGREDDHHYCLLLLLLVASSHDALAHPSIAACLLPAFLSPVPGICNDSPEAAIWIISFYAQKHED